MTVQIEPSSTLGRKWGRLIRAAGPLVRSGVSEGALYAAWDVHDEIRRCPAVGPVIYTALDDRGAVMWVGSTGQPLKARVRAHLRDPGRAAVFDRVAAIPLRPDTAALEVGFLERHGRFLLHPVMGSRWPTGRRTS